MPYPADHASSVSNAGDRFNQAGQAAEENASQPGRVARWAERNHKFGDMFDTSLKPVMVSPTAEGVMATPGVGIYNAVKK